MPGPPPKRSEERRHRTPPTLGFAEQAEPGEDQGWPNASGDWHPAAKRFYRALRVSGQAQFYEQSDRNAAWIASDLLSELVTTRYRNGNILMQFNSLCTDLLATEGSRRRARLELQKSKNTEEDERHKAIADQLAAYREAAAQ